MAAPLTCNVCSFLHKMNISSGAKVGLIVDTAGGLESTLGPKYSKALERRAAELAEVNSNTRSSGALRAPTSSLRPFG